MDFKKFIVIPVYIAILAAGFIVLDLLISPIMPIADNKTFGWVTFQAWAMYFLAGCTVKGGVRTFLGYVLGILSAILIIELARVLGPTGFWAFPLAVLVMVIPMCSMERAHSLIDFVPAIFVSSAVYFAFTQIYPATTTRTSMAVTILVYCGIGMILGYITIKIRAAYEKMVAKVV
jgi:hypothetical protein